MSRWRKYKDALRVQDFIVAKAHRLLPLSSRTKEVPKLLPVYNSFNQVVCSQPQNLKEPKLLSFSRPIIKRLDPVVEFRLRRVQEFDPIHSYTSISQKSDYIPVASIAYLRRIAVSDISSMQRSFARPPRRSLLSRSVRRQIVRLVTLIRRKESIFNTSSIKTNALAGFVINSYSVSLLPYRGFFPISSLSLWYRFPTKAQIRAAKYSTKYLFVLTKCLQNQLFSRLLRDLLNRVRILSISQVL
jgi:hypothetical protein